MTDFEVGDYIRRDDGDASAVFKVTVVRIVYHGHDREGRNVTHKAAIRPMVRATDSEVDAFVTHKLRQLELSLEYAERNVTQLLSLDHEMRNNYWSQ